jgi:hypothetical protein
MTEEQRGIVQRDRSYRNDHPDAVVFGTRPYHFGKFYSVHPADPAISDAFHSRQT